MVFVTHIMIFRDVNCLQVAFQLCSKIIFTRSLVGVCFVVSMKHDWATCCNLNSCAITTTSFLTLWKKQVLTIITAENHGHQSGGIQHLKHSEKAHFKTLIISLHNQAIMSLLIICNLKDTSPGVSFHRAS